MKFPKVITVASEKGGVGKTTIATNLAVYLKAMREDLPVTILSFDNHFTVDKMYSIDKKSHEKSVRDLFYGQNIKDIALLGQYGVSFVPSCRDLTPIGEGHEIIANNLAKSMLDGILIIDTRPIMDFFTISALEASDIVLVPVKDLPSLNNVANITDRCENMEKMPPKVRLIPSIVDGMVKFKEKSITMDDLLRSVATERGYELMNNSIPKSPKVESLATNLTFQVYPIINHARGTLVHKRFSLLTRELLGLLEGIQEPRALNNYREMLFTSGATRGSFESRMSGIVPFCPLCGGDNTTKSFYIKPDMLFFESGRHAKGFIDRSCFVGQLLDEMVKVDSRLTSFRERIVGNMDGNLAVGLNFKEMGSGNETYPVKVSILDEMGSIIAETSFNCQANSLLSQALSKISEEAASGYAPCIIKLGGSPIPDSILLDENYQKFQPLKKIVAST